MKDPQWTRENDRYDDKNIKHAHFRPYESKELVNVGFASQPGEPTEQEIYDMVDLVISEVLGPQGLAAIIKPQDKVIIKVNICGNGVGSRGAQDKGGIPDPRVVRYVAEKVRKIIGFEGTADLKVVDTVFTKDKNPSAKDWPKSFYWARIEKNGDNAVDDGDICYDDDADGILDGDSHAQLVNLDSIDETGRFTTKVKVASGDELMVSMPKFLRTRKEAEAEGSDEYCDVLIGIPMLKSHDMVGITGAIKLGYGFRYMEGIDGDTGRWLHSGLYVDEHGIHNRQALYDYLCAQHIIREYDFVLMDCLVGNRKGPTNPYGRISISPYSDSPIDYLETNALLASRDSVAIDTVAAVLAGYDPKSIELLQTGFENGIGTNNPEYIEVAGQNKFYNHRQYLYNTYARDRYPFEDNWGGAKTLPNYAFQLWPLLEGPVEIKKGVFGLKYKIIGKYDDIKPDLSRVELWVNGRPIDYRNEGDISRGRFMFDIEEEKLPKNSSMQCNLIIWDKLFNALVSEEVIFES